MNHFFKNMGRKFMMLLALAFVFTAPLMAQDSFPDISTITAQNLFQATIDPLYGMLTILFGYISGYLPVVNKWKPFTRVFAFALAIGLGLYLFGGATVWKLAFTYFISSGMYAVILQNILKSPKAVAS